MLTLCFIGLLVSHPLGLVERGEAGKCFVQDLVIGLIAQVSNKDAEVIFWPLQ